MRAMWTAATGMKTLQLAIDNTSHNLANVNTAGYKKQRMEFQDLLYERLDFDDTTKEFGTPVNLQLGHGVMAAATVKQFTQGSIQPTENPLDLAIQGDGFFEIEDPQGNLYYTRNGSFKFGLTGDGNRLVTDDGYMVKGVDGNINLAGDYSEIAIDNKGIVSVKYNETEDGTFTQIGQIKLVDVPNPAGLTSKGENLYALSTASGQAFNVEEDAESSIKQGYIEMSNVQVVDEMINLITQQRAYEVNSKTIQTADSMLEIANNLKR